jgi:D-3-phosphoglycerate dehydrogenase / 2-oxoglutarate reductase
MSFKIVMPLDIKGEPDKYPQIFNEMGAEFVKKQCRNEDEFIDFARDADALITVASLLPVTRRVLESLECCRLIANTQVGFDCVDVEAATEHGILVANVPDYCVEEVADHTMALLLACARRVVLLNSLVKSGSWGLTPNDVLIKNTVWPKLARLSRQTLGLLGLGRIGRAVAIRAKAFGMRVIAFDPYIEAAMAERLGVELLEWKRLLNEADFISIHAALSISTRHIFNDSTFAEMKPAACLINCARGGFIDEQALSQALKEGKIAMAALDVLDTDPPCPDNPLLTMDNVIITGHSAFFSPEAEAERWRRPIEEIACIMRAEWPRVLVNPQAREKYIAKWGPMKEVSK